MKIERATGARPESAAPSKGSTPSAPESHGIAGLGVDVGVLVSIPAGAVYERAPEPVSVKQPQVEARDVREPAESRSAESPLAALAARAEAASLPRRELVRERVSPERPVELSFASLERLAAFEAKAPAEKLASFDRLRRGNMLLTADAQALRSKGTPISDKQIESLAAKLAKSAAAFRAEDLRHFGKLEARFLAAGRENVAAFVQRVLRECYLIQNELLADYAAKVQFHNDLKKKIREQAQRARETKTAWASEAKTQKGFLADPPFDWVEFDDNGEPFVTAMTEEDVKAWRAITKEAEAARADSATDGTLGCEQLYGASGLSNSQRRLLDKMVKDKDHWYSIDGENDNFIRDNMGKLVAALPCMNAGDLDSYLPQIVKYLSGGWADEDELIELFEALAPAQLLYLISGTAAVSLPGTEERLLANGAAHHPASAIGDLFRRDAWGGSGAGKNWLNPFGHARASTEWLVAAGGSVGDGCRETIFLAFQNAAEAVANHLGRSFDGSLEPAEAGDLLAALKAQTVSSQVSAGAADAGPQVGDPKRVRTASELEDYLKKLEERMSSIGDDAQLANVDLQNALQQQQQTLQMMSNIAKVLHDTAMAIVRKHGS